MKLTFLLIWLIAAFGIAHANMRMPQQELYICKEKVTFTVYERYSDVEAHFWLKDTGIVLYDEEAWAHVKAPVYIEFPVYIPKLGYGSKESSTFWREFQGYTYYTIDSTNEETGRVFKGDIFHSLLGLEMQIKRPFKDEHRIDHFWIKDPVANPYPKPPGYLYDTLKYSAELTFRSETRRLKEGEELEVIIRYRQHHISSSGRWKAAYTPNLPPLQRSRQIPAEIPEDFQIIFNASDDITMLRLISESSVQKANDKQIIVTAEDWSTILVEPVVISPIDPFPSTPEEDALFDLFFK